MRIWNTDWDKLQTRNLHLWIRYHLRKATRGRRSFNMHSHASGAADLCIAQVLIVALLFGFSMVSYFDRTIMSIAGPQLMLDFGVSPTAMGSVYSAFILGYALTMIP